MSPRLRIRELREKRGLSQQALADLADVRQPTISELETGTARRVNLALLDRLAAALGVSVGDLFADEKRKRGKG